MSEAAVKMELRRAAWEYGKLGLLVDDSPESSVRVARALYGGEVLPKWWRQVRSLDCACLALEALRDILQDPKFGRLRSLVIIDRYLPLHCSGGKAIPWDWADYPLTDPEKAITERLCQRVREVKSAELGTSGIGPRPAAHVLFVTSFPAITARTKPDGKEAPIEWQTRSVELLQEERRKIQKRDEWKGLLRFGPEESARILKKEAPSQDLLSKARAAEAKWRARAWQQSIDRVAELLRSNDPVILLTGAGASLAAGPTAPGMPSTHVLLQEACEHVRRLPIDEEKVRAGLRETACACQASDAPQPAAKEEWKPGSGKAPLDWLVEQSEKEGGVAGVAWKLEEVFSKQEHEDRGGVVNFDAFHSAFRDALHRWDYAFAYHHWLLARLPWAGIITTNFDGFHERASQAVATLPWLKLEDRLPYLRRGTLVEIPEDGSPPQGKGLLFKPYGNLYSAEGTLALDLKEIDSLQNCFRHALTQILLRGKKAEGALVVLGHSMRDDSIGRVLRDYEAKLKKSFDLIWVDPMAYERCMSSKKKMVWETWMRERVSGKGEPRGGPMPGTALEFLNDLWSKYHGL